jgi:TonB-linked SusC/RagA family outer membrane protein
MNRFNQKNGNVIFLKSKSPSVNKITILTMLCVFIFGGITSYASEKNIKESESHAQNQLTEIKGNVSNSDGPLPGATVIVKGTSNGTTTDFDGNYSISVDSDDATLVFSFLGHQSQEIALGNSSTVDVILELSTRLDEVVVVGYTTKKRGEITGSISTLKAEDIASTSNREVAKSLAGRVTGLIASDRGGLPGSDSVSLLIRGQATLNNNAPLILIDGIPAGVGTFNQLSPQDIDNLSVLKDGAAAVYGNRAANGVILVTTKRGKSGKPRVNISTSYALSSFSSRPKLMTSSQFATYENEIAARNGNNLPYSQQDINSYASGSDLVNFPNTNWFDGTFADSAPEVRSSVSVSGGTEKSSYFVSLDNLQREGLFKSGDNDFKQNQIRSNVDFSVSDEIKLSVDLSGRFAERRNPGVPLGFIYKHIYTNFPTDLDVYPNGLIARGGENGANPLIMSTREAGFNDDEFTDLRSRIAIDINLDKITQGLSLNAYTGLRRFQTKSKDFYNPWTYYSLDQATNEYLPNTGFSQQGQTNILRDTSYNFDEMLLNASLRYNNTFADVHSISLLAAFEQIVTEDSNFYGQANNLPTDQLPYLFAGDPETAMNSGSASEQALLSYFGTLSYDYDKRYFIDLMLRRDGSSRFGPGKRFGNFYSIGGNWAIGNEKFMENISWLDALNIKGSYSVLGNDRITPFQFLSQFTLGNSNPNNARPNYYVLGESGAVVNGFRTGVAPNPNVTWETATMSNIAISFSAFNSRLSGEVNFYKQIRDDILVSNSSSIPNFTGVVLPDENLGRVDSQGYEITLGWNDQVGEVSYNLGMNLTQAQNEVVFLPQPENIPERQDITGFRIGSYVVAPTNGIFQNQSEVDNAAATIANTVEGEPHYIDTNEDGRINNQDWIRINSSNIPEIQYGFTGGVNYKDFNLNFLFQGQAKAKVLVFFDQIGSKPEHVFNDRWTPGNRTARYPRAFGLNDTYSGPQDGNNSRYADLWYHDASFLRLKEVEVGYTFSKEKTSIADIKIFARGFNLLTMFSEVQKLGLDPEAASYNNFRNSTYPSLKMYSFGLNITF